MAQQPEEWWTRIENGTATPADLQQLREAVAHQKASGVQWGKYNVQIVEGREIHIGDRTYVEINEDAVRAIATAIQQKASAPSSMSIGFEPYLRAIAHLYSQQNALYTPTDALLPLEARSVEQQDTQQPQERQVEQFPVLTGLRKYALGEKREHVLLAGRPGSGKSTALKQLAIALAEEGQVPVLVQLKGDHTVSELIQAEFRRAKQRVTLEQIEDWLLDDRLILLLDGVNEIPNDDLRRGLAQFREDNLTVPMIFTTRELAVGGDLGIDKRLEMKPLSEPQMRDFVKKYLPEQGEQLLGQLRDRLREIAETPLFLKMLCDLFKQTREIPQNKGELFRQFDRNYERLKKDYVPVSKNFWEFKSEVLQHLAFSMMQADVQKPTELWLTISKQRAESILEKWLHQRGVVDAPTKAKKWLKDLCKHHLLQDAAKPGEIEFHHQLFQEYYAAEYLLQHLPSLSDEQLKQDYLNYLKWTEAIAFMLALPEVTEKQAVKIVELALEVDLMLGARLAGAVVSTYQSFCVALINNVKLYKVTKVFFFKKTHFIEIPDWLRINLLEATQSVEAFPTLRKLLKSLDPSVRASTAYAIGRLGHKDAESDLIELQNDSDPLVSKAAKSALWSIESEEVAPKFFFKEIPKLLERNERTQARATLKENQKEEIWLERDRYLDLADLRKHLDSSESALRRHAVIEIEKQNLSEALPQLLEMLHDPDVSVRCNIVSVLGKLGNANTAPKLLELINDPDSNVVKETCEALGKLGNKVATSALVQVLEGNSAFRIRQSAAKALGELLDQRAIPCLITSLEKDESLDVRWEVAQSLANLGDCRAIPLLSAGLTEPCRDIRVKAIKSLAKLKSPEIQVLALEALKDPDMVVRDIAAKIMIEIGDKRAIPQIASLLEDSNLDVSWTAVEILKKIDISLTTELLPRLTKLLPSNSGKQAFLVIRAIQTRCKYYNHEIWQEAIQSQEQAHLTRQTTQASHSEVIARIDQTTQQIDQRTRQMISEPKSNFSGATFNAPVNFGDNPTGAFIGTQNNYSIDPELQYAIADLQALLTQLQIQHPYVTTKFEAIPITHAKLTEIKQSKTPGLANLRKQLLNPERHLQATKATLGEVAKHYLEESVWAKAVLTYLDKLSEDPNLGA